MKTQIETKIIDGLELKRKVFYLRSQIVRVIYTVPPASAAGSRAPKERSPIPGGLCPMIQRLAAA